MARPCGHRCSKAYLIIFNLIFLLFGGGTLGLGIWMNFDSETFMALHIAQGSPQSAIFEKTPYVLMGVGGAMMIICFIGGCGACAESVCFLCFYFIVLLMLVLGQIIGVALMVGKRDSIEKGLTVRLRDQVHVSYNRTIDREINKTDLLTFAWDAMQVELECCGAFGPEDYMFSTWWNHTNNSAGMSVPYTCCRLFNDNPEVPMVADNNQCQIEGFVYHQIMRDPTKEVVPWDDLHTNGCASAVLAWVDENSHIIISLLSTSIVLQVLSLFFACFLITRLKREHTKDWLDDDEEK